MAEASSRSWLAWVFLLLQAVYGSAVLAESCIERVAFDDPKARLGRQLFFWTGLSGNREYACSSCHRPELAFTDGVPRAVGSTGERHGKNTPTVLGLAGSPFFGWSNSRFDRPAKPIAVALLGREPVEMGLAGQETLLASRVATRPGYLELFHAAFPEDEQPIHPANVIAALEAFIERLSFEDSPYDRWIAGQAGALSAGALRGAALFTSPELGCASCHRREAGPDGDREPLRELDEAFANTALYDVDGTGAYPAEAPGLIEITGRLEDRGRFRIPSLSNVARTAPYMHDGSVATLAEVVDHYAAGGRVPDSPARDARMKPFVLSELEKRDLLLFLESLDDDCLTK